MESEHHSSPSSEPHSSGGLSVMARVVRRIRSIVPELKGYLLNGDREALRIGRFRLSGECHQWMYDRVSLKRLLEEAGFSGIRICSAFDSRIEEFASFEEAVARYFFDEVRKAMLT